MKVTCIAEEAPEWQCLAPPAPLVEREMESLSGIGTDLVEVERFHRVVERWGDRFLNRVFTRDELATCMGRMDPFPCLAVRFAAKEAVMKAIGTGLSQGVRWRDVEVLGDEHGIPQVALKGRLKVLVGDGKVLLSLSHTRHYATAVVIITERRERP
jgi:holo-[acyl-carrier protein] synthase